MKTFPSFKALMVIGLPLAPARFCGGVNRAFSRVLPQTRSLRSEMEMLAKVHYPLRLAKRSNCLRMLKLLAVSGSELVLEKRYIYSNNPPQTSHRERCRN